MKRIKVLLSIFFVVNALTIVPIRAEDINVETTEPIILKETEKEYYYDKSKNDFVEKSGNIVPSDTLFEIVAKHTWFKVAGRKIDVDINVYAKDSRAQIQRINGNHTMQDTASGGKNVVSINVYNGYAYSRIATYAKGTKSFTSSHTIKCTVSYYITLLNGYVLNGGKITQTEYLKV